MASIHHFAGANQLRYANNAYQGVLALDDAQTLAPKLRLPMPEQKYLLVAGSFPDSGPRVNVDAAIPLSEQDVEAIRNIMKNLPTGKEFTYETPSGKMYFRGGEELDMRLSGNGSASITVDRKNAEGLVNKIIN